MTIYYLGPPGSFSEEAGTRLFPQKHLAPAKSIEDVIDPVKKEREALGIVPIENSLEGPVIRNFDLILESKVRVCGEISLPVHQNLISKEETLRSISTIYSHPHAFAQVRKWLKKNLPRARLQELPSTSAAAKQAANEPYSAAIASTQAAILYGLKVLAKNINDTEQNITRFWIIGTENLQKVDALLQQQPRTKTSCYAIIKNKVGTLGELLNTFAKNHISLTSIQSRPLPHAPWQYGFFIDILVDAYDPLAKKMFAVLKKQHPHVAILGTYPQFGAYNRKAIVAYNVTRIKKIFLSNLTHTCVNEIFEQGMNLLNELHTPPYLAAILKTRFMIMPSVAIYKYRHHAQIKDDSRERMLLRKIKKSPILYPLYKRVIEFGRQRIQEKIIALLKKRALEKQEIVSFTISQLRYYIDYLDTLAISEYGITNIHETIKNDS